ncbi:MAG TPA: GNAT family N-acetyltransferase [Chthoniobacter sp.]|nr:GNAT family N-acetyltransferase [Chthoniobacter sp.]
MDTPIVIRSAALEDSAALAGLMTALGYPSTPEQMQRRLVEHAQSKLNAVFVAVAEAQVVGLISFHCSPTFHVDSSLGRITSLVVDSGHRRSGIGQRLVEAAEEFARASGCARVEVTSGDHRADAHAFYEQLGYHADCRRFIKRMDAV